MTRRPLRLRSLLRAGMIDSTGMAFGWTVFLLVLTRRGGLDAAAVPASAMLIGIALSAPFSAWLSPRLSPRDLLRVLALGEGAGRLSLFGVLWLHAPDAVVAVLVAGTNVLAWTAFAAMRAASARAEGADRSGHSLTRYAAAIAASEALAAGAASLLLRHTPSTPVLVAVAAAYALALAPQWWVGLHADPAIPARAGTAWSGTVWARGVRSAEVTALLWPCLLGAGVFLLAGGPALLATVLAYQRYGSTGVLVSALAFAGCSLGAPRLQPLLSRWRPSPLAAVVLGAVLVGGWTLSGRSLLGLAVAQGCAGLAQCTLEGELDARVAARLDAAAVTTGLAFSSSARALGGALAVALLPVLLTHTSLSTLCAASAGVLLLAAVVIGLASLGPASASFVLGVVAGRGIALAAALPRMPAWFTVGFLAGLPVGVLTRATGRAGTDPPAGRNDRWAGSIAGNGDAGARSGRDPAGRS